MEERAVPAAGLGRFDKPIAPNFDRGLLPSGLRYEASTMYVTSDGVGTHATTPGTDVNLPGMASGLNVDGVAQLTMFWPGVTYLGSAALLSTGKHLLTAAHNVADDNGNIAATRVEATFQLASGATQTVSGTKFYLNGYTGDFFNIGNDLAIIELDTVVDASVPRYDVYLPTDGSELDKLAVKVGYGRSGIGSSGATTSYGIKRAVLNEYDSVATTFGAGNGQNQLAFDFDNGISRNDGFSYHFGFASDLGKGGDEGGVAPGDSGGPTFLKDASGQWVIAGVTSYGIRFGIGPFFTSDVDGQLNSSWGEFGGDTRVSSYADWINDVIGAPPAVVTDAAVTTVSATPNSVNVGGTVRVDVTVANTGNQLISADIPVTVTARLGNGTPIDIGSTTITNDLAVGASTQVSFDWNTAGVAPGTYTVTATQGLSDDNASNNSGTANVRVNDPNASDDTLYLTVAADGAVGGLTVQNEDILKYQGGAYTLFFDGTPALGGPSGGFAIDAFAVVSDNEVLVSVDQFGIINGTNLQVRDEDIVKFTKNGSGAWTASMYFDGSDVGLTTSIFGTNGAEGVDAFELLPDGSLLISTKGNCSVPGLSGADEDVIRFRPNSLGSTTTGTWSSYFDGSNFGLGNGGENEDVDGIAVAGGNLYLSTKGNFSVNGLSGTGSDVFVFTGSTYSSTLFFSGSSLGGSTLFSIDLPPL